MTAGDEGGVLSRVAHALHELCQPLTALQCRLEIDQMEHEGQPPNARDRTIADCLRECERLNGTVTAMRAMIRQALVQERGSLG